MCSLFDLREFPLRADQPKLCLSHICMINRHPLQILKYQILLANLRDAPFFLIEKKLGKIVWKWSNSARNLVGRLVTSLQQHKYVLVCSDFLLECVWHLDTLVRELFIEDNGYIAITNRIDRSASGPRTHI